MAVTTARVLMVDDEPRILDGYRRTLGRRYPLTTVTSGPQALETIQAAAEEGTPFAVVITDMMMPGMNGAQFLTAARRIDTDLVAMVLSGQADMASTIDAVNGADLFRFLQKPSDTTTLRRAIDEALRQHRLVTGERELMARTLGGAVEVLIDLLRRTNPDLVERSRRITVIAEAAARDLGLEDAWRLQLAASLSQIGCVAVPADVVARAHAGDILEPHEAALFEDHPRVAADLVSRIPRLEEVSRWISRQPVYPSQAPGPDVAGAALVFAGAVAFVAAQDVTPSLAEAGTVLRRTYAYPDSLVDAYERAALAGTDVMSSV